MAPMLTEVLPITAPPLEAPRRGLLAVARQLSFVNEDPERWIGGVTFEREPCSPISNDVATWVDCPPEGTQDPVDVTRDSDVLTFATYDIEATDECTTLQRLAHDGAGRARRKLDASTSRQVERELWTGALAQQFGFPNLYLTDPAAMVDITPASPVPLVYALGELQMEIVAQSTGRAMIHCAPRVANLWYSSYAIHEDPTSGLLLDVMGNIIVPGSGYDGSGPATGDPLTPTPPDPTGQTSWIYATGIVAVGLGKYLNLDPPPDTTSEDNLLQWRAQRPAVALWDGCVGAAVNVDLCNTCCTGPLA